MLIDQQGESKSALQIVLEEAAAAGAEEFCVVVCPATSPLTLRPAAPCAHRVRFVVQRNPGG